MSVAYRERLRPKSPLSTLALLSFIVSFSVARTFTTFYPNTHLVSRGIHIHHFWFGLALLSIGGWLGISYNDRKVDRLSAILYGTGGGLIADEVGLLLTFEDYWSGITYTFTLILLAIIAVLALLHRFHETIVIELSEFLSSRAGLYVGVFLASISIAFVAETSSPVTTAVSGALTVVGIVIVLAYLLNQAHH